MISEVKMAPSAILVLNIVCTVTKLIVRTIIFALDFLFFLILENVFLKIFLHV